MKYTAAQEKFLEVCRTQWVACREIIQKPKRWKNPDPGRHPQEYVIVTRNGRVSVNRRTFRALCDAKAIILEFYSRPEGREWAWYTVRAPDVILDAVAKAAKATAAGGAG